MAGGWIHVITGCMFSGKTDELLRLLRRAEIAGRRVILVRPTPSPAPRSAPRATPQQAQRDGERGEGWWARLRRRWVP